MLRIRAAQYCHPPCYKSPLCCGRNAACGRFGACIFGRSGQGHRGAASRADAIYARYLCKHLDCVERCRHREVRRFFLPSQPVIFPVVALLSAPLCAIGVSRVACWLKAKEGFSSCGQLFRGNLNRSPVGLGLALLLVLIASVASVVCPTFAQEALKNSGVSAPETGRALRSHRLRRSVDPPRGSSP